MKLYDFQEKIVEHALYKFKTHKRQMIVVPTGGGKTVIFAYIIKTLDVKSLVIAHTKELISQAKQTLLKIGCVNTDVLSVPKANSLLKNGKLSSYKFMIIDECHRAYSLSYQKIIDFQTDALILGVTATPFRTDGNKLKEIFSQHTHSLSLTEMIRRGLLVDFEGYRVQTKISLDGVNQNKKDFREDSLGAVINVSNRNELIVREYKKLAPGEKALCFAANIKHSIELAHKFNEEGIIARSLSGKINKKERNNIIKEFKTGQIQVLVNCKILTEGFDEPSITCLIMARPTCSKLLFTQMIGRGSRKFPGKQFCKIIEFTDNDFDVTSLDSLIKEAPKTIKLNHGERFSEFAHRVKKYMESTDYTITEQMTVIPPSIYEQPASQWQLNYLRNKKIKFFLPLTERLANQLITDITNGNYRK